MKTLIVLPIVFFLTLAHFSAAPMPTSVQETTAGGNWCTHYLKPKFCPAMLINGSDASGCHLVPVNVPWYWCFYNLDTVPTMSNCTSIPSPNFPSLPCGDQVISSTGSGGCWEHVACVPLF